MGAVQSGHSGPAELQCVAGAGGGGGERLREPAAAVAVAQAVSVRKCISIDLAVQAFTQQGSISFRIL